MPGVESGTRLAALALKGLKLLLYRLAALQGGSDLHRSDSSPLSVALHPYLLQRCRRDGWRDS